MTTLGASLVAKLAAEGPIPFDEFMAACLYDPVGGFFSTGGVRSAKSGDFLTSPEVSRWFGRTVARFVSAAISEMGRPHIVEVAAGSGSLIRPLLADLDRDDVTVTLADVSPAARRLLETVNGVDSVVADLGELRRRPQPGFEGVIVANELLDNLPVALAVRHGDLWEERWVGSDGDTLALVTAPAREEVHAWADAYGGVVPDGGLVEVQLAAGEWVAGAVSMLDRGALVVFDYGGTAEELEPRRTLGTLRTYRSHHLGPHPLDAPGETDVTVDVNFTAMTAAAEGAGATVQLQRQDDFLTRWGLRDAVGAMRRRELELARSGDPVERLAVRSERTDAETLLHERGLGDFRVMVAWVGGEPASAVRTS